VLPGQRAGTHARCSGVRAHLRRREAGEAEHACGRAALSQPLHAAQGRPRMPGDQGAGEFTQLRALLTSDP